MPKFPPKRIEAELCHCAQFTASFDAGDGRSDGHIKLVDDDNDDDDDDDDDDVGDKVMTVEGERVE